MMQDFKQFLKPQTKRNSRIYELRQKGKTLEQIGELYNLSRQRVQQIISQEERKVLTKSKRGAIIE